MNLTVTEALDVFEDEQTILKHLKILDDIRMGYITLEQPATTLSGEESQRVKLAKELGQAGKSGTLYILDEPTIGLHYSDVLKLLMILDRLVDQGNTVLIVENDLDILSYVDYLVELGTGGGPKGGEITATGTPEAIKTNTQSRIAPFF